MSPKNHLIAIYDFEFFPYALGDVLTWNLRTAMRCHELNRTHADVYICIDEKTPASIYQRGLINPDNFELFFNELYSAFGTNPKLGNLHIFRQRELMLAQLEEIAPKDEANLEILNDYLSILTDKVSETTLGRIVSAVQKKALEQGLFRQLSKRFLPTKIKKTILGNYSRETILNNYFIKYIYSHEKINHFFKKNEFIPYLEPALGCKPDIDELIMRRFSGKKLVAFHLRLRQLDIGYGGNHTYLRDSDFLEWYDFLKTANKIYPEVQFIALGRLQEKPLDILRLPNVASLRLYGMGLGHELTLMLKSNLFIGSSSGFAAFANFSSIPYFITKMNAGSCQAYDIPYGTEKLPFAKADQKLIYETETSELLLSLLERGLDIKKAVSSAADQEASPATQIDLLEWSKLHLEPFNSARTTSRFYDDENYRHRESAYLLLPSLEKARQAFISQDFEQAKAIISRIECYFSSFCGQFPPYLLLKGCFSIEEGDRALLNSCLNKLQELALTPSEERMAGLLTTHLDFDYRDLPSKMDSMSKLKSPIEEFNFLEIIK